MATFHVEIPHNPGECLRALDEITATPKGNDVLDRSYFGCGSGVHNSWAVLEAENESAARQMLPPSMRDKAKIVGVSKHTPETIRAMHMKM